MYPRWRVVVNIGVNYLKNENKDEKKLYKTLYSFIHNGKYIGINNQYDFK